ncbi:4-hydroxyphenylacetate 3-hydroxylase N-terminal domain-containing protein [Bacillus sp. FSL W7-1360]
MAMTTGDKYLKRIAQLQSEVWLEGECIRGGLTKHAAFRSVLQAKAKLYDMVQEPAHQSLLQSSDHTSNFTFEMPRTKEDLVKRGKATRLWANEAAGVLGRSPDYVNTIVTVLAASKAYFSQAGVEYGENIQGIYERAVKHDYTFTHTFVNPPISRKPYYPDGENQEVPIAAKIIDETAEGLVIDGARLLATQGGMTDEILVLPSTAFVDSDYLYGFAIPSDTKGLRFLCRPSVCKTSVFDYPLSSQFEEGDAIVVFDHVLVPWSRVFLYRNELLTSDLFSKTGAEAYMLYQAANRQVVKTEWLLGLAQALVDVMGIEQHQHVQGKIAEMIIALEAMRGFVCSAESQAQVNEFELMVPKIEPLRAAVSYYQATYPRLVEMLQLLGASHFIAAPNEQDFASPIASQLERFVRGESTTAKEKTQLIRCIRDMTMTEFGIRQTLYERYFFGDPIRVLSSLYHLYEPEKAAYRERVERFLKQLPHEKIQMDESFRS